MPEGSCKIENLACCYNYRGNGVAITTGVMSLQQYSEITGREISVSIACLYLISL